jgi:hypothetical protein
MHVRMSAQLGTQTSRQSASERHPVVALPRGNGAEADACGGAEAEADTGGGGAEAEADTGAAPGSPTAVEVLGTVEAVAHAESSIAIAATDPSAAPIWEA